MTETTDQQPLISPVGTSARIFGTVDVSKNGDITLRDVQIVPFDDQFNLMSTNLSAGLHTNAQD